MSGEQTGSGEAAIEEAHPRIYVASLSDYNAGVLHGRWIYATVDPEILEEAIGEMLADSPTARRYGDIAEEWAIHDYEGFGPALLGEYEGLRDVHNLATGLNTHGPAFAAWWALDSRRDEDHADVATQFEQAYIGDYSSLSDYGDQLLDELGLDLDDLDIPEGLRPYVQLDVAGWTRDMEIGGDIVTAESERGVYLFWNNT